MNKKLRRGAFMLFAVCLMGSMSTGCSDDDPDYENVTPPVVEVSAASISGLVTAISGVPVSGANVTATQGSTTLKATTNNEGVYTFEKVETAGTYALEVTAGGKQPASGSVTVKAGETGVWNVQLANEGKEVTVSQTEETKVEVTTETTADNKEAEVTVAATIPPAAVAEGEKIVITPIYSATDAEKGRAASANDVIVAGTRLACSNPNATLKAPIELEYQLDGEVAGAVKAQKYVNGKWTDVTVTVENGNVKFQADEFASYSLFLGVSVSTSVTSEAVTFSQASYDNLYGSQDMAVGSASYTYRQGAEISSRGTGKLAAYLVEILARQLSGSAVKTATGSYPLNVTLPVGTALKLSGSQAVENVSISSGSRSVSGKRYGSVSIAASTYNRQHSGGTN